MLSSLFITQVVTEVGNLLERTATADKVMVCDQTRFGKALAAAGLPVIQLASKRRSLRRSTGPRLYASAASLPVAAGSVSALVCFGLAQQEQWQQRLAEWARVVREDGQIVLVDKAAPAEITRRALCGGLADIEQRSAGRYVITNGSVPKLP